MGANLFDAVQGNQSDVEEQMNFFFFLTITEWFQSPSTI